MLVNTALFRADCSAARVYYAVRALDKKGCGFGWYDLAKLHKITGFCFGTLRRLLGGSGRAESWWQVVEFRGNTVFVKYRSEAKILETLPKEWRCRHIQRLSNLRERMLCYGHAILAKQVQLQRMHELKLRYSINAGKRKAKELIGFDFAADVCRKQKWRPTRRRCLAEGKPAPKYQAAVNLADIPGGAYTTGVSQRTVAAALGLTQPTVSFYLKQFANLRVQVFAPCSIQDVIEGNYILHKGKECKRLTYVYKDTVSTQHAKQARLLKLLPLKLTPKQLKVAKLAAILRGFPYSVKGAGMLIAEIGLERFLKNVTLWKDDPTKQPWYRIAHLKRKYKTPPLQGEPG